MFNRILIVPFEIKNSEYFLNLTQYIQTYASSSTPTPSYDKNS